MMDIGLICTLGLSPQEPGCGAADTHDTCLGSGWKIPLAFLQIRAPNAWLLSSTCNSHVELGNGPS